MTIKNIFSCRLSKCLCCSISVKIDFDPELFTKGKFDITEFVGSVSEKLIAESKADNGRASVLTALLGDSSHLVAQRSIQSHSYDPSRLLSINL